MADSAQDPLKAASSLFHIMHLQALKPVSSTPSLWVDAPAVTRTIAVWCGHLIPDSSLFPALLDFQFFSIPGSSLFPAPLYSRLPSIPGSSLFPALLYSQLFSTPKRYFLGLCPMLLSSRARRRCGIGLPYCVDSRDLTCIYIALTPPRTANYCAHSLPSLSPSLV
jgi:hypothetical protein